MTDHAQAMLNRILVQFADSKNLEAIICVLGNRLNKLEQVYTDLQDKRWIDTAEGVQLDGCGVIVDQSRLINKAIALPFFGFKGQSSARGFGKARFRRQLESHLTTAKLADPEYKKIIKAKVAKNISLGTSEEVIASLATIFDVKKIIVTELGNAKIRVGVAREMTEAEKVFAQAVNLFVKPSGVGIDIKTHFNPDATFGFKDQGMQGFGVGKFANTF